MGRIRVKLCLVIYVKIYKQKEHKPNPSRNPLPLGGYRIWFYSICCQYIYTLEPELSWLWIDSRKRFCKQNTEKKLRLNCMLIKRRKRNKGFNLRIKYNQTCNPCFKILYLSQFVSNTCTTFADLAVLFSYIQISLHVETPCSLSDRTQLHEFHLPL